MTTPTYQPTFAGSVIYGADCNDQEPALILDDSGFTDSTDLVRVAPRLRDVMTLVNRPTSATVEDLVAKLQQQRTARLIAIGSGAAIDVAKLAYQQATAAGGELALTFIPCGPEPYRAVARFAVVDEIDGSRPTVDDVRFAAADVIVDPDLLARVPRAVLAVAATDTAVHAIESLLSSLATPFSRLLASQALQIVLTADSAAEQLLTASFAAAEAFGSTRLGIAHAIASPLGTRLGVTHDAINAVLGEPLLDFWADSETISFVTAACGEASVASVRQRLSQLRQEARLPDTLSELDVAWDDVLAVLPRAVQSSGIAVLPRPLADGALESFANIAWCNTKNKEDHLARPA